MSSKCFGLKTKPDMAFTMHSHSGQFCPGHAKDSLEDVILRAIAVGMKTIGLTEHMPRVELSDLYPEEVSFASSCSSFSSSFSSKDDLLFQRP